MFTGLSMRKLQFSTRYSRSIRPRPLTRWMSSVGFQMEIEELERLGRPRQLEVDLRTTHAGEVGAVFIYKGASSALNIRERLLFGQKSYVSELKFLSEHQDNESSHAALLGALCNEPTVFCPLWRVFGFLTGFIPGLFGGPRALYYTIISVETFVEEHYRTILSNLAIRGLNSRIPSSHEANGDRGRAYSYPLLAARLSSCCEDEIEHKEEAEQALLESDSRPAGLLMRSWTAVVQLGSKGAVAISSVV